MTTDSALARVQSIIEVIGIVTGADARRFAHLAIEYISHLQDVGLVDRVQYEQSVVAVELARTRSQLARRPSTRLRPWKGSTEGVGSTAKNPISPREASSGNAG